MRWCDYILLKPAGGTKVPTQHTMCSPKNARRIRTSIWFCQSMHMGKSLKRIERASSWNHIIVKMVDVTIKQSTRGQQVQVDKAQVRAICRRANWLYQINDSTNALRFCIPFHSNHNHFDSFRIFTTIFLHRWPWSLTMWPQHLHYKSYWFEHVIWSWRDGDADDDWP